MNSGPGCARNANPRAIGNRPVLAAVRKRDAGHFLASPTLATRHAESGGESVLHDESSGIEQRPSKSSEPTRFGSVQEFIEMDAIPLVPAGNERRFLLDVPDTHVLTRSK